jgi:GntR family galactonate operon transcriptional repressor
MSVGRAQPSAPGAADWSSVSLATRPTRLSEVVIGILVEEVVSGRIAPGNPLPPEPVLCKSFGVSRSVIREACKALEEKGLVQVRRGNGTIVADEDAWNLLDPLVLAATVRHDDARMVLDDLIAVRVALESDMAAQAAQRRTEEDVARLRALIDELSELLGDPERHRLVDVRFHDTLMRLSGNRLSRAVVRAIHDQARASSRYHGDPHPEDLELTHRGHVAVVDRIAAGDAAGASAAMREHILTTWAARRPPAAPPTHP